MLQNNISEKERERERLILLKEMGRDVYENFPLQRALVRLRLHSSLPRMGRVERYNLLHLKPA